MSVNAGFFVNPPPLPQAQVDGVDDQQQQQQYQQQQQAIQANQFQQQINQQQHQQQQQCGVGANQQNQMSNNEMNQAISSLLQNPLVASGAIQINQEMINNIQNQNNVAAAGGVNVHQQQPQHQQQQQPAPAPAATTIPQNNNTGFGSFFFNPLALFTTTTHAAATNNNLIHATAQDGGAQTHAQALANSINTMGNVNYQQQQQQQHTPTVQMNNTNRPGQLTTANISAADMLRNNPALGAAVYQHKNNPTTTTMQHRAVNVSTSPAAKSPMPMGFMTPHQGTTPCPTPPLPSTSPVFHDAHMDDNVPMMMASVVVPASAKVTPTTIQIQQQQQQTATVAPSSKSFFRRGVSSMGSALGTVATYVNQSFLSGIPFHVADRAMMDSKETYAKWWEDGINQKKRKKDGSGDEMEDEDGDDNDSDENDEKGTNHRPEGKKRKLDNNNALDTGCTGSALSNMLKKYYEDMGGVDTSSNNFVEGTTASQQQEQRGKKNHQHDVPLTIPSVDSSIINSRRKILSQVDYSAETDNNDNNDGYESFNAFNDVGGMYDFGYNDGNGKTDAVVSAASKGGEDDYDSLYNDLTNSSSATTSAAVAADQSYSNSTTMTSNTALDGTMQVIYELLEEKNQAQEENEMLQMIGNPRDWVRKSIRSELVESLQAAHGDVTDKRFLISLEILSNFYKSSGRDARVSPWSQRRNMDDPGVEGGEYGYSGSEVGGPTASDLLEGHYVNMSRPNYIECLGKNGEEDFMYSLGRMSFDMFQPSNLVCSVQSTHNTIKIIGEQEELPEFVPKSLREEVARQSDKRPLLRSYDIAVSMTIEPPASVGQPEPTTTSPSPTKRLRAVIAVKGYILPDPDIPNRLTIWFTGGKLCPARLPSINELDDDQSTTSNKTEASESGEHGGFEDWKAMFAKGKFYKTLGERARAMAAKLLLGADVPNKMEDDGHMEYVLHRPVGGHGKAYVDVSEFLTYDICYLYNFFVLHHQLISNLFIPSFSGTIS